MIALLSVLIIIWAVQTKSGQNFRKNEVLEKNVDIRSQMNESDSKCERLLHEMMARNDRLKTRNSALPRELSFNII